MGKRSSFRRRPHDLYDTPIAAVAPLIPHLAGVHTFAEPCFGNGALARHLVALGLTMVASGDIREGVDALDVDWAAFPINAIITNPPWSRDLLHPLITHLSTCAPTWLLIDADWAHTKQAIPYLQRCSDIVSIGRLKWLPDTKMTGKDNAVWAHFDARHTGGIRFHGREENGHVERKFAA